VVENGPIASIIEHKTRKIYPEHVIYSEHVRYILKTRNISRTCEILYILSLCEISFSIQECGIARVLKFWRRN
jgi:hypothetical protein